MAMIHQFSHLFPLYRTIRYHIFCQSHHNPFYGAVTAATLYTNSLSPPLHLAAQVINDIDDKHGVVVDDIGMICDVVDTRELMTHDYANTVVEYNADCVSHDVSPNDKIIRNDTELKMIRAVRDDDVLVCHDD